MKGLSVSKGPPVDRRWLLRTMALGGVSAAAATSACARASGSVTAEAVDADSVVLSGAGGNVFATATTDGVLLVDTGLAEHAQDLMAAVARRYRGAKPVAAFNTHWHYDHTGGNRAVKAAGAKIYAHENTRLWLQGDFDSPWQNRHYAPQPEAAWPTDTFYVSGSTRVGGRDVDYIHLPRAHTDGDVVVHLKDADVLVAGDIVSVGAYPILDYVTGGWIGEMCKACDALLEIAGPNTKIVPGTGPVVGKDHLQAQRDMLVTVRERLYAEVRLGRGVQEMLDDRVTEGFDEVWGDPVQFVNLAYPGMWGHSSEIGQVV